MEKTQEHTLRRNQVRLVNDLDPKDVLDVLLDDGILTENDYEQVKSGKSRKERCRILLALLPTRGPTAYGSFQRALKQGIYPHLAELLHGDKLTYGKETSSDIERSETYDLRELKCSSACSKCKPLFPTSFSDPALSLTLRKNCCLLVGNIEPCDLLDWFYQEFVLDRDECDLIRSGRTRKERLVLFLQEISKCENGNVLTVFKMSLRRKYRFILEKLDSEASDDVVVDESRIAEPELQIKDLCYTVECSIVEQCDSCSLCKHQRLETCSHIDSTKLTTAYQLTSLAEDTDEIDGLSTKMEQLQMSQADNATIPKHDSVPFSQYQYHRPKRKRQVFSHQYSSDSEEDASEKIYRKKNKSSELRESDHTGNASDGINNCSENLKELCVSVNPGSLIPGTLPNRRLEVAFNLLSTMINQGQYDRFDRYSTGLKQRCQHNADMMCILGYLSASKDLFRTDFDSAKKHITTAMDLVPKTSNPKYFTLELFTALTRMYITRKKLNKLQRTLDDAKMIIASDPVGCTGRASGWLYMNDARNMTALISMLNVHKHKFITTYKTLHEQAKQSFQLSLKNFQRDGGKDGPFGFGYALCRLTILLLQCGDSGRTMDILHPASEDIELAGSYIRHLEDSDIPIPKILEVHFLLAKSDYQYRRGNMVRALECAEAAYKLATEINMLEFTDHALNRVTFLRTKTPIVIREIGEEEAEWVLFEESADSSY